jgi:hypothetical protein
MEELCQCRHGQENIIEDSWSELRLAPTLRVGAHAIGTLRRWARSVQRVRSHAERGNEGGKELSLIHLLLPAGQPVFHRREGTLLHLTRFRQ